VHLLAVNSPQDKIPARIVPEWADGYLFILLFRYALFFSQQLDRSCG
jgi:hypothetical protein